MRRSPSPFTVAGILAAFLLAVVIKAAVGCSSGGEHPPVEGTIHVGPTGPTGIVVIGEPTPPPPTGPPRVH